VNHLEDLIEKSSFLLSKQKEVKAVCDTTWKEILSFIDDKIKEYHEEPEAVKNLEEINDILSGQAQKQSDEAQDDIDFLCDQIKGLEAIEKISDNEQKEELLKAFVEKDENGEEFPDFTGFKKSIEEDADMAKRDLKLIFDDIRTFIEEGNIKEIKLKIEAMIDQLQKEKDANNGEEQKGGACCGSYSSSENGCSDCSVDCSGNNEGDIFSFMSNYDKELEKSIQLDPGYKNIESSTTKKNFQNNTNSPN
jgi:hypothetical protein